MSELSTRDPYYPNLPVPYGPETDPYRHQFPGYINVTPPAVPKPKYWLHIGLFVLTIATTTLMQGWMFSASLLAILTAHEFGHYFAARYWGVPATLPYFIPFPSLFGTLGALIKMSPRIPNRRALFDIAAAGPLAGLVVALPVTYFGITLSHIIPKSSIPDGSISLSEPLLFQGLNLLAHGRLGDNVDMMLHPLAFAGWAGLFVTALNLLPIGQLDGGHIVHSLFGNRSHLVAKVMFAVLGLYSLWTMSITWLPLMVLLLFFGVKHPSQNDDGNPLGFTRLALGALLAAVFFTCFSLAPISL
jgi:membrane-associated protease RseP (regulator of RpoE activity)